MTKHSEWISSFTANLPSDLFERLCRRADLRGITIDQAIIELLDAAFEAWDKSIGVAA